MLCRKYISQAMYQQHSHSYIAQMGIGHYTKMSSCVSCIIRYDAKILHNHLNFKNLSRYTKIAFLFIDLGMRWEPAILNSPAELDNVERGVRLLPRDFSSIRSFIGGSSIKQQYLIQYSDYLPDTCGR